jgi:tetratricopeptide (TPR) repeat protein
LVHRDFKPNNVMIDDKGRVRVMDFGLARASGTQAETPPASPSQFDAALTASGMLLGTPAYMAPEQLAHEPADARTDQFSFCVALYEALCGVRPFVGEDTDALRNAIVTRQLQRPQRRVPAWLLRVVERGLKSSPSERWPSMDALVAELGRERSRRRNWALFAAAMVLVAVSAGLVASRRVALRPCRGAEAKLAGVWDDARRAAVKAAFNSFTTPDGAEQFILLAPVLDRYVANWKAAYTDACEATNVRGEQSTELLDLRMACLQDRVVEVRELVSLFQHPDAALVIRAPTAGYTLEPVASCEGKILLRAGARLPQDPTTQARAAEIAERLAKARAYERAARYDEGLQLARAAVEDATHFKLASLAADGMRLTGVFEYRQGHVQEGEATLTAAGFAAHTAGNEETECRSLGLLAAILATHHRRLEAARLALGIARASLARLGERLDLEIDLLFREASIADYEEKPEESIALLRRALDLARQRGDDYLFASMQTALGRSQFRAAHYDDSLKTLRDNAELFIKLEGPNGNSVSFAFVLIADVLIGMHRPAEAVDYSRRALEIKRKLTGEDNHWIIQYTKALGQALDLAGRFDEAVTTLQKAIAIAERIHDSTDSVPSTWFLLGRTYRKLGQLKSARAALEHSLSHPQAQSMAKVELGSAKWELAQVSWMLGQHARALALAAEAEPLYRQASPGEVGDDLKELVAWRKKNDRSYR